MADLTELGFDANQVEPGGFDLIPPGEYDAVITKSEVKGTSTGGKMLKLQLQICNGPLQNRVLFDQLNLWNSNAQAVQIAKGTMSAICRAVNVLTPKDSSELHDKPMRISVGIQKGKGDYEGQDQNRIKAYKPRQSGGPAPTAPAGPTVAQTVAQQPW
jgi:hypothetical protein